MSNQAQLSTADHAPQRPAPRCQTSRQHKQRPVGTGQSELLDASIRRISTVFSASSHEHWAIRTPGMRRIANVDLSAEWLSVSLSLRLLSMPINIKIIGSMLSRNAGMNGCSRIIGQRRQGRRQLVTDIPVDSLPWDSAAELDVLVGSTIADLNTVLRTDTRKTKPLPQAEAARGQVEASLDEAGWPALPGETGHLEVPLEVPGGYFVACVTHDGTSARLAVPILGSELAAAPQVCRNAMTVLLWLTASRIRMVKPVRSRRSLALEVSLPPGHCNTIGLGHACAALSVALQRFAAEAARLVADQDLARIYLSNLGFSTST